MMPPPGIVATTAMNSLFPWAILYYTCQLGPCHCNVSVADRSVLEKKSAVVQRLFQWVGIWCVYTHDIALSDTMQGRWDLRRARGCGYRQVRVPGASAGDSSCATAGIEPSTVLDSPSAPKLEPTAGGTTPLTRQGQPIVPSPRCYTTRSCWRKTRLLRGKPGGMS